MNEQFEKLTNELKKAGFVAYCRESPSGHAFIIAGTHELNDLNIKLLQNAIMITCDPTWEVRASWPGQVGQEFQEKDFDSALTKAISLLNSKK